MGVGMLMPTGASGFSVIYLFKYKNCKYLQLGFIIQLIIIQAHSLRIIILFKLAN